MREEKAVDGGTKKLVKGSKSFFIFVISCANAGTESCSHFGVVLDVLQDVEQSLLLGRSEQPADVVPEQVVVLLDLPEPESQLPHPVDATSHSCQKIMIEHLGARSRSRSNE